MRKRRWGDVLAGATVSLVLVPQALAYADIAGMPPIHGLYAAAAAPIAAAFFASSPYLQTGPVAMTSLLTFGALSSLAATGTTEYVELAALLALVVGAVRIGIGLVRAGVISYFMSQPVLVGFTAAAALLIAASQVPAALGVEPPAGKLLERGWWALVHPGEWDGAALGMSALTAALILAGRRIGPLFPGVLVAVVAGLVWSLGFDYGAETVGAVPGGLPGLDLGLPWSDLLALLIPGAVIAVVGFAEPAAIARTFAAQDREIWDADREFISQGTANLAAGVVGGFPVGGSFSRSSLTRLAGGRSRWSGAVTGLVVLAFLPFAGIVEDLPRAVLAATVIVAVSQFIRIGPVLDVVRASRPQGVVAVATLAATLLVAPRIERGVIVGVALGVAIHLWRELRVTLAVDVRGTTIRLRPSGVLFFLSFADLDRALLETLATHPEARRIVFDLEGLGRIDYTGARAVRSVGEDARAAGLTVAVVNAPDHARRILRKVWPEAEPFTSPPD